MSPKRPARSRSLERRDTHQSARDTESDQTNAPTARGAVEDAIEDERARLMDAETILHCVVIAMNETDPSDTHGPYYQNVIEVARDLVVESINRLDSVRMRPMLERFASERPET